MASIICMYTAWSAVSKLVVFARIYSSVVTAGDEANGHVRPSSSLRVCTVWLGPCWLAGVGSWTLQVC